jgi:hypothetical protein
MIMSVAVVQIRWNARDRVHFRLPFSRSSAGSRTSWSTPETKQNERTCAPRFLLPTGLTTRTTMSYPGDR